MLNKIKNKICKIFNSFRFSENIYRKFITLYFKISKNENLSTFESVFDNLVLNDNQESRINKILNNNKISIIDVGGRWGHERVFDNYLDYIDIHISEPEENEIEILKKKNYNLIPYGFWNRTGKKKLFVTHKRGNSSIFKSNLKLRQFFWNPSKYEIVETQDIKVITINEYCKKKKINPDYLKIDTQGSEYEILLGSSRYFPLLMHIEISFHEVYSKQKTFFEIFNFLHKRKYMILRLPKTTYRNYKTKNSFYSFGIPLHGNALFVINPFTQKGKEIILKRKEKFISLLLIYGFVDLINVCDKYFNDKSFSQLVSDTMNIKIKKTKRISFSKKDYLEN